MREVIRRAQRYNHSGSDKMHQLNVPDIMPVGVGAGAGADPYMVKPRIRTEC